MTSASMKDALPLMLSFVFVVLALHRNEVQSEEDNSGLQFRATQKGLDYAGRLVVNRLFDELQTIKVPDVGDNITNIRITRVTKPSSSVVVNSDDLTLTLTNAALSIGADWHYVQKVLFAKISDSGSLTCSLSDVTISVSVRFGIDAFGHPTISTTGCSCSIPSLSLKLHGGGASWLFNIFIVLFKTSVRNKLEGKICDAARNIINGNVNEHLTSIPLQMPVGKDYMIDYRCLSAPVLQNGCFLRTHKALFYNKDFPIDSPFAAEPIPTMTTEDKMVTICISDYVPNTMGYAVYTRNILTYTLKKSDLPPLFNGFLSTTCSADSYCMGNIYRDLPKMYPNGSVKVTIAASKAPITVISAGQIQVTFHGTITCRARLSDGTVSAEFLTVALVLKFNIAVAMDKNLLKANVTRMIPTVKAVSSSVGSIPKADMIQTIETLCNAVLLPMLNGLGQEGIPIPAIKNTALINTSTKLNDNCLCISADALHTQ